MTEKSVAPSAPEEPKTEEPRAASAQPNAHELTLEFWRFLSEAEWREVVEQARQLPYAQHLRANAVVHSWSAPTELGGQQAAPAPGWQPIKTAPKDRRILGCGGSLTRVEFVYFSSEAECWTFDDDGEVCRPAHWYALPAPPGRDTET